MIRLGTENINYLDLLDGSNEWYWGSDCTHGDLYEAEELFKIGHKITSNRLLFVKYPSAQTFEPIKAMSGQYFGRPFYCEGAVYILLVNFNDEMISIIKYTKDFSLSSVEMKIPLSEVKDCYNLLMFGSPLILTRQGNEGLFEIIYPERISFEINSRESFCYAKGDKLYFSMWYEDPDYREEVIVRDRTTGKILENFSGTLMTMPNGEKWLLG